MNGEGLQWYGTCNNSNNSSNNNNSSSGIVASTKDTTLIGRISDVVRPEREPDFVA